GGHVTFLRGGERPSGTDSQLAYRDVVYRGLWPGIDARVSGVPSGLKYSFEIAPHSDPQAIHLRYEGADRITVDHDSGQLTITAGKSAIVDAAPTAYQHVDGPWVALPVHVVQPVPPAPSSRGQHAPGRPLVIPPPLDYSPIRGSSGPAAVLALAAAAGGWASAAGPRGA